MVNVEIKQVSDAEVLAFANNFRGEQVDLSPNRRTTYYGAIYQDRLIGVVGWQIIGKILRYKSDAVLRNFRGNGIYDALFQYRDNACKGVAKKITAFCSKMSLNTYIRHDFCSININKNGVTFVERYERI